MSKKTTKTAADLMQAPKATVFEDMFLTDVIAVMLSVNVNFLPVVDADNMLLGIITEYDVMNFAFSGEAARTRVSEAMSRNVMTFAPTDDLETIVNTCLTRRLHRAPVVHNGKLVGILGRHELLREILAVYRQDAT
ncbi:MAG: CBS domain-containing protein [Armatimonadota bacterium]